MTPLRAFIAEDEPPARDRLLGALARVAPQVQVVGQADSVSGTQAWLADHPAPDLLLLDIQLSDGLSLELFQDERLAVPTIFTTAYDRFAIDAFRALAVDYLLKPVGEPALAQALQRVERLRRGFGADVADLLRQLRPTASPWRQRLVGRRGGAFQVLPVERLAYVVSVDKLAVAVDDTGQRLTLDTPLAELETGLDPARFFRASRQLLVSVQAVKGFVPAGKGRVRLDLQPTLAADTTISPERAAAFRAWLGQ
jgi:DNA-binding LytR/AlgR family response regulator